MLYRLFSPASGLLLLPVQVVVRPNRSRHLGRMLSHILQAQQEGQPCFMSFAGC